MNIIWVRRGSVTALVGSMALTGALVASPSATAAAENGNVDAYGYISAPSPCTVTPAAPADPEPVLTDNGAWVSDSYSRSGTVKNSTATVATVSTTSSVSAKVTPLTGGPARFDASVRGTATRSAVAGTACDVSVSGSASSYFSSTLTQPMWASVGGTSVGGKGFVSISIYPGGETSDGSAALSFGGKSTGSSSALLLPGRYYFDVSGRAYADGDKTKAVSQSFNGSLWAILTPAGYASSAQTGKARRFMTFAGARDCAHAALGAAVTKKAHKAAKKVVLRVNGRKKLVLKGKKLKRTSSVVLGGLAPGAATVKAVVTTKKGVKVTTSRSYLACS